MILLCVFNLHIVLAVLSLVIFLTLVMQQYLLKICTCCFMYIHVFNFDCCIIYRYFCISSYIYTFP